jgi:hypothetical protein
MTNKTLPILFITIAALASPALAQTEASEAVSPGDETVQTVPAGDETPTEAVESPTAVEGPLYVVAADLEDPQDVNEIYRDGEETFLGFFWFWFVAIAALAGVGGLAWWIWGKRNPRRMGKL